jgi:hypothetical protein
LKSQHKGETFPRGEIYFILALIILRATKTPKVRVTGTSTVPQVVDGFTLVVAISQNFLFTFPIQKIPVV